jgi:hypothetical protein
LKKGVGCRTPVRYPVPVVLMVTLSNRCPTCSDTCPPDAAFCISCGASLAQPATATTRLLKPRRPQPGRPRLPLALVWRWRVKPLLFNGSVAAFGLALLTLVILIAYVGTYTPGLDPVGWLFVLAGAIHLVRGTRRGEPLVGMRYAVLCAAFPVAQVTQAFITTTVLFGGAAGILLLVQFLVSLVSSHRWRP